MALRILEKAIFYCLKLYYKGCDDQYKVQMTANSLIASPEANTGSDTVQHIN